MGELTARSRYYRNELLGLEGGIICVGNSIEECEASENDMHTSMAWKSISQGQAKSVRDDKVVQGNYHFQTKQTWAVGPVYS